MKYERKGSALATGLDEVLQECSERLESGESVASCARRYPAYATEIMAHFSMLTALRGLSIYELPSHASMIDARDRLLSELVLERTRRRGLLSRISMRITGLIGGLVVAGVVTIGAGAAGVGIDVRTPVGSLLESVGVTHPPAVESPANGLPDRAEKPAPSPQATLVLGETLQPSFLGGATSNHPQTDVPPPDVPAPNVVVEGSVAEQAHSVKTPAPRASEAARAPEPSSHTSALPTVQPGPVEAPPSTSPTTAQSRVEDSFAGCASSAGASCDKPAATGPAGHVTPPVNNGSASGEGHGPEPNDGNGNAGNGSSPPGLEGTGSGATPTGQSAEPPGQAGQHGQGLGLPAEVPGAGQGRPDDENPPGRSEEAQGSGGGAPDGGQASSSNGSPSGDDESSPDNSSSGRGASGGNSPPSDDGPADTHGQSSEGNGAGGGGGNGSPGNGGGPPDSAPGPPDSPPGKSKD